MNSSISSSIFVLCFAIALGIFVRTEAKEFMVGGNEDSWSVPSSSSYTLNKWAEANRFRVGDSLVWKYDPSKDSVLQVTREAYLACNATNPIASYTNKTTIVTLVHSGAYYFISGNAENCQKGEKVIVVVMSEKHSHRSVAPAPGPASLLREAPALAPVTGASDRVVVGRFLVGFVVVLGVLGLGF